MHIVTAILGEKQVNISNKKLFFFVKRREIMDENSLLVFLFVFVLFLKSTKVLGEGHQQQIQELIHDRLFQRLVLG